jgi:hypothetical protein
MYVMCKNCYKESEIKRRKIIIIIIININYYRKVPIRKLKVVNEDIEEETNKTNNDKNGIYEHTYTGSCGFRANEVPELRVRRERKREQE